MNPKIITVIDPAGAVTDRQFDGTVPGALVALDDLFGPDAELATDPFLTIYEGTSVTAYVDDEAVLKGHPSNANATRLRTGPDLPREPIHGRVALVPNAG